MRQANLVVIGVSIGLAIGILVAFCAFVAIRLYRKRSLIQRHTSESRVSSLPIRTNGIGTSMEPSVSFSNSEIVHNSHHSAKKNRSWWGNHDKDVFASVSGIPRYSYKDIQKATQNFTTILGQGSFGPVYKAIMPTKEVVAVKVLASDSKQGEKEFQTEVLLLARLHHRNLVNLIGYCVDKGQHMLVYEFMSSGSLASLLYGEGMRALSWDERLQIAQDISHGIEYLHEGAVPPVIHRDLKSANILLDGMMRAKVADFGLSKEEVFDGRNSGLKAINPQQGLMDYINLAVMDGDGKAGWDEILDKELVGKCNSEEVGLLARIAYKCVQRAPRKRPSILDVSQTISGIRQWRLSKEDTMSSLRGDISHALNRIEHQQVELSNMTSIKERSRV
ncbi:hypothetical protein MRB53_011386 [Persea americana]|uniref:Uncharacterized protein n=1 Tax=Persea americana TaxID=3435 RepID=A0ACC2LUM9_PERAE|nr:hypothetical protein MRB53_011386 [Persea americana]